MNEMNAMSDKEASSVEDTEARSAMKLALELFEQFGRDSRLKYEHQAIYKTIVALKEALAGKQEQRSVRASADSEHMGEPLCTAAMFDDAFLAKSGLDPKTPLYTTPQQPSTIVRTAAEGEDTRRAWVGLTDEELSTIEYEVYGRTLQKGKPMIVFIRQFAKAIESALKGKNTHA
jgi:hypothetical protein